MKNKKTDRNDAIQNLVASIAVMTWSMDLEMSAAILKGTAEQYGEEFTGNLMEEILEVLNGEAAPKKDLLNNVAALAFIRPVPFNWSPTIH